MALARRGIVFLRDIFHASTSETIFRPDIMM